MAFELIIVIVISVFFGVLFFIVDFYKHSHPKLHISLIAGISIAYFFLVLLPEISVNQPVYPLALQLFEFLFVVIGFAFVHVSEKFILQKVEAKSQKRMRKLIEKEKTLEAVQKNIENILTAEIVNEKLNEFALKDLVRTITELNNQEKSFKDEINRYKNKIQSRVNEDLGNLRFFTNFTYHLLVGIIVVGLLSIDIIPGILFFFYAWFRAIITNRSEAHVIFTDLEIYETYEIDEIPLRKYLLSFGNLIGVGIGIILEFFNFEHTEFFYIIYSFISGVILYSIVSEILPKQEKGNPLFFLIGFLGFSIVIFIINIYIHLIQL